MAIDLTLTTIVSGYNTDKINENFVAIEEALVDAVSRSGNSPNSMDSDLDLDGNNILNAGDISGDSLTIAGEAFVPDSVTAVGPPGDDASVTVGVVTTGAAGSSVIITNSGTSNDAILNFTIPRGNTGASGPGTGDMVAAQNLNDVVSKPTAFANIKQAATQSATGVVEQATDAEVITGTDVDRYVTPAGLQAKVASATASGIVELATNAETLTGTDATRAVTPASLKSAVDSGIVGANDLTSGTLSNSRLSSVAQGLLAPVQDSVGTYCFAKRANGVNMAFGDTTSGSNLNATNSDDAALVGPSLTGTWRLMGDIGGGSGDINVSVWARIA